jgi:hypothetical protein
MPIKMKILLVSSAAAICFSAGHTAAQETAQAGRAAVLIEEI